MKITVQSYQSIEQLVPVNGIIYCEHEDYEIEDGAAWCTRCDKQGILFEDIVDIDPREDGGIYTIAGVDWDAL